MSFSYGTYCLVRVLYNKEENCYPWLESLTLTLAEVYL